MKLLFLSLLLFFTSPISKPYKRLTYADFRGHGPKAGHIYIGISLSWEEDDSTCTPTVAAYFLPDSSYLTVRTPWILAHEQGHFDLCESYARRLRVLLPVRGKVSQKAVYDSVYDKMTADWMAEDDRYDSETHHSEDSAAQRRWWTQIATGLAQVPDSVGLQVVPVVRTAGPGAVKHRRPASPVR
jgi:hypothetical protein